MKQCPICGYDGKDNPRSSAANAFYWGVLIKHLSQYSGLSPHDCHLHLRAMFLPQEEFYRDGKEYTILASTATLSQKEFHEYNTQIEVMMLELGIQIPNFKEWQKQREAQINEPPL